MTLQTGRDANGSYETTEAVEGFTIDSSGYADETPTFDASGNLAYDGVYRYRYDAWNRLVSVTKAYRDSGGTLQEGATVAVMSYDGLGRRITRSVQNSADLDATYHDYYSGQQVLETRNGSDQTLKQWVWGLSYVDELVQVALNNDPDDSTERTCESAYWALTDANYNVLGLLDSSGALQERYEYSPYGQRTVYTRSGANDPACRTPMQLSKRWVTTSAPTAVQPYGLCEAGHQGLRHDEESGLVYNRARMLHAGLGRFMQREPLGYVDGMSLYQYVRGKPLFYVDPTGQFGTIIVGGGVVAGGGAVAGGAAIDLIPWIGVPVLAGLTGYEMSQWLGLPEAVQNAILAAANDDSKRGDCNSGEYIQLSARKAFACQDEKGCNDKMSCRTLLVRGAKWSACAFARKSLDNKCFKGGNKTHQEEVKKATENAMKCIFKYIEKKKNNNCECFPQQSGSGQSP